MNFEQYFININKYFNAQMSRSQPKPKIIFKTLEDLIKSSSLSKNNTCKRNQTVSQTIHLKSNADLHGKSITKSISKVSIKSREKEGSTYENTIEKQNKNSQSIYDSVEQQISKVYDEIELFLHQSKEKVILDLRNERDVTKVDEKVKELQKMSDYLKHIIEVFTSESSHVLVNQKKILKESIKQNEPLEKLSLNQKKKSNFRFIKSESDKKPTIYEKLLNRIN